MRLPEARLMPIDRADITDRNGRHIPVVKRPIPGKLRADGETPAHLDGPRNARELATLLDSLSCDARRIPPSGGHRPEKFHEAKSEFARDLDRLSQWARRQCF